MNDEGVGLAGWLMADLVLVLAFIFLAMVPGREALVEALVVEAPTIRHGCISTEPAVTASVVTTSVECLPEVDGEPPEVDGEPPITYSWTVTHGTEIRSMSKPGELPFQAEFSAVGAITLVASNEKWEVSRPSIFVVDTPECTLTADFRFSQIVLTNIALGKVSWADISIGRVGIDLSKDQEDEYLNQRSELNWSDHKALEYLHLQQKEGFRIALVETFARSIGATDTPLHRKLANEVNTKFFDGINNAVRSPIFVEETDKAFNQWFAAYRDTSTAFDPNTARINLYFVSPLDANCTDGN